MSIVYFAHSYRERDTQVVDFFARLMRSEGLTVSLDPPSDSVNSAKLQRHLNASDGMIAVLSRRDDGTSPHILYEINLAVKSGVPLLVFIEDTVKISLAPRIALQRFSRQWFLRESRDHRHALRSFRCYLREVDGPTSHSSTSRRACAVVGLENLEPGAANALAIWIEEVANYEPHVLAPEADLYGSYELLRNASVAVAVTGAHPSYADGLLAGIAIPTIALTAFDPAPLLWPPEEYRARTFAPDETLHTVLGAEFEVFEEDFLDLTDQGAVDRYASTLIELQGRYDQRTRSHVQEIVMGDKYVAGQGVQGPNAHVHDVTFQQQWNQFAGAASAEDNLGSLAMQLEQLRQHLHREASTRDEDATVAEIGAAATAAEAGDGPKAMSHLAKLGKWALTAATAIGTTVAAAAIKAATGL